MSEESILTEERLMGLLDFEKALKGVEIVRQEETPQGAVFVVARLHYPHGEAAEDVMTVPFVYWPGSEWIFTPEDWQAGDLPMEVSDIGDISWRVNDTDEEGSVVGGVPGLLPWQREPIEPVRVVVGRMLRQSREKLGLTVREVAEKAGLTHSHVSRIESGKYNITVDTLERLCRVLGLEIQLMDYDNDNND